MFSVFLFLGFETLAKLFLPRGERRLRRQLELLLGAGEALPISCNPLNPFFEKSLWETLGKC